MGLNLIFSGVLEVYFWYSSITPTHLAGASVYACASL